YWDYPTTVLTHPTPIIGTADSVAEGEPTFNVEEPEDDPSDGSILPFIIQQTANTSDATIVYSGYHAAAPTDDAWLASSTPVDTDNDGLWDTWPQITNLNSAYRWRPRGGGAQNPSGDWVRDSGRFADIGRFFTADPLSAGDDNGIPSADLTFFFDDEVENVAAFDRPNITVPPTRVDYDPLMALYQQVYDYQMDRLGERYLGDMGGALEFNEADQFDHADTRHWADTDGDQFPDARWQTLDILGDLFGYRWVVAARIIDNTALINVNTATESGAVRNGGIPDLQTYVDGLTPADVNLYGLLLDGYGAAGIPDRRHEEVVAGGGFYAFESFDEHLIRGLRAASMFEQLARPPASGPSPAQRLFNYPVYWDENYQESQILPAGNREALYRYFGVQPPRRVATAGVPYPLSDEVDLRAFWGFNYSSQLSKIEQRLDGPEGNGLLPGTAANDQIGVLRSKELTAEARRYDEIDAEGSNFDIEQKIENIQRDIRRFLTTYNGVAQFSPVPVINRALATTGVPSPVIPSAFSEPVNLKVNFNDLTDGLDRGNHEAIRRAFEAFVWSLAPLASNTPYQPPLTFADMGRFETNVHYGGGANGPAPANANASYAVLRAASLAINLADACDSQTTDGGARPTIGRFITNFDESRGPSVAPLVDPNIGNTVSHTNVVPLYPRVTHGDITDPAAFPVEYTGDPNNGVTLVGLERQPFISEVISVAAYHHDEFGSPQGLGEGAADIDPNVTTNHLGSIIAVELANPWPQNISADNYDLVITNGSEVLRISLNGLILGGGTTVFYYAHQVPEADLPNPNFKPRWDEYRDAWVNAYSTRVGTLGRVEEMLGIDQVNSTVDVTKSVLFQEFAGQPAATAILIYDDEDVTGAELLVDRMSPPSGETNFPRAESSAIAINVMPALPETEYFSGGAVSTAAFRRPWRDTTGVDSGFPQYVIERPEENLVVPASGMSEIMQHSWRIDPNPEPEPPASDLYADNFNIANDTNQFFDDRANRAARGIDYPPFQLFVPDGPLQTVSELHQLCVFTHMYIHESAPGGTGVDEIRDVQAALDVHSGAAPDSLQQAAARNNNWITIGEQLGFDENRTRPAASGSTDPYFGVLDPTRYVLTADLTVTDPAVIPETLRVPLATRVFDCFEPFRVPDERLALQGRININTAPRQVLEQLPQLHPRQAVGVLSAQPTGTDLNSVNSRLNRLLRYRDFASTRAVSAADFQVAPDAYTQINGLRTRPSGADDRIPGFLSIGELPIFHVWEDIAAGAPGTTNPAFGMLELAVNNTPENMRPFDIRRNDNQQVADGFDPADDPEERLALFRAISNIATTRSD
ncbi:MAG: hypothetical protein VYC34_10485, partial [Planctomycetota bacterium]|nr:hypothetical protein [Planctomycetota bacterium]